MALSQRSSVLLRRDESIRGNFFCIPGKPYSIAVGKLHVTKLILRAKAIPF